MIRETFPTSSHRGPAHAFAMFGSYAADRAIDLVLVAAAFAVALS